MVFRQHGDHTSVTDTPSLRLDTTGTLGDAFVISAAARGLRENAAATMTSAAALG
jgi:hypothetical protein